MFYLFNPNMQAFGIKRETERLDHTAHNPALAGVVKLERHPREHLRFETNLDVNLDP